MVSKELLEKAKKCSSKEELLELAKSENVEVSDDEINVLLKSTVTNRELSDDELENVTGGYCYSGLSYAELGITPEGSQLPGYHPIIVSSDDLCPLHTSKNTDHFPECSECGHCHLIDGHYYCSMRSMEYNPVYY